jgi:hypothetical protein
VLVDPNSDADKVALPQVSDELPECGYLGGDVQIRQARLGNRKVDRHGSPLELHVAERRAGRVGVKAVEAAVAAANARRESGVDLLRKNGIEPIDL